MTDRRRPNVMSRVFYEIQLTIGTRAQNEEIRRIYKICQFPHNLVG